jgi:AraC family transcriptional regulator
VNFPCLKPFDTCINHISKGSGCKSPNSKAKSMSPLVIEVTANNPQHILPKQPLLSSYKAKWDNLALEYHLQPAYESPGHYAKHYTLVIRLRSQLGLERWLDECYKKENTVAGDVVVIPPYVIHKAATTQQSQFIALTLEPEFVSNIAHESVDPGKVDITPHFSKPDPLIYQIALALKATLQSDGMCCNLYADSMATALSAHLLQHYSAPKSAIRDYEPGLPKHKLQRVIEFIMDHLAEDLLLAAIAQEVGMSQYHFSRLFKQATGLSPYQYVIQCRIEHGKFLLLQGRMKISEVASAVGFADQSQFTRHFKRYFGVTPKEIR